MKTELTRRSPERLTFTTLDGVEIVLDVWRSGNGPQPIVLSMTPYLRATFVAVGDIPVTALNDLGITVIVADVRGTGESGGVFPGPLGDREIEDGVELIEWLSANHARNGRVAMIGGSYGGANQLLIAARRPKGLVSIAPAVAPTDFYRHWTHWGGFPSSGGWGAFNFLARTQPTQSQRALLEFYYTKAMVTHEDGALFRERSPFYHLEKIEVPTFLVGGLFDFFSGATYRAFPHIRSPKRMVFGPWGHSYPPDPTELLNWSAYWLLDRGEDPTQGDNVHFWRLGADRWATRSGLGDPVAMAVPLGEQPTDIPVVGSSAALPDQTLPLPLPWLGDPTFGWGEVHHIELDVASGIEIEGAPVLDLGLDAPDCLDLDLFVRLSLVGEKTLQLTEGRLRLSHRAIDEELSRRDTAGRPLSVRLRHVDPSPLSVTGNRVVIEMLPTSLTMPTGCRLRLGFAAVRADGRQRPASITLATSSALILPVRERLSSSE